MSISRHRREDIPIGYEKPLVCRQIEQIAIETLTETMGFPTGELVVLSEDEKESWGQYREKGQQLGIHAHTGAFAAVVYYAQVPENSSSLYLLPNGWVLGSHENERSITEMKTKTGLLAMFSGNIPHYTHQNMSDDPRVAYAFNLFQTSSLQANF